MPRSCPCCCLRAHFYGRCGLDLTHAAPRSASRWRNDSLAKCCGYVFMALSSPKNMPSSRNWCGRITPRQGPVSLDSIASSEKLMTRRFQPLSSRIGARAVMSRPELMDPAFAPECLEALERYGVLVFPALSLSDEEQIVFSSRLGDVIPMGGKRADGTRDPIFKVSLDPKHNEAAEYLKGTVYWHIDGATEDVPARATMLSARRISAVGGQTEFCNSYAAYDDLPEA